MHHRSIACAVALAAAMLLPASALAQDSASSATQPAAGRASVRLDITRFKTTRRGPVAKGKATVSLCGLGGMPKTTTRRVTLQVRRGGRCNILTLTLAQLDLDLLGVNVHLDRVNLRVTGRRRGGVLGRLFCSLAGARVRASQAQAVRALNSRLHNRTMRPMAMSVPVTAQSAQATTCPVLDLVLGPLHLDLLGLVVDLNRVHLSITATRGGGVLGDLLCGLAAPAP
jgi:hypothetical protein